MRKNYHQKRMSFIIGPTIETDKEFEYNFAFSLQSLFVVQLNPHLNYANHNEKDEIKEALENQHGDWRFLCSRPILSMFGVSILLVDIGAEFYRQQRCWEHTENRSTN